MEECALTTEMLALPANVNRGITPEWKKWSSPKSYLVFLSWYLIVCINFK